MTKANTDARWDDIPGFDYKTGNYTRLDTDAWLRNHRIREIGRERGEQNFPSTDQQEMDDVHSKTFAWVNHRGRQCKQDVSQYLADFVQQLNAYEDKEDIASLGNKVTTISNDACISLDQRVRHDRNELTQLETAVRQGTEDYERFRKKAGLTNLPDYSDRKNAFLIILFCALFETALNASLLMNVNPMGLIGSAMQMVLISAVNILVGAFVIGFALRCRNLVSRAKKIIAWMVTGVFVMGISIFNLLAGHFRDTMQALKQKARAGDSGDSEMSMLDVMGKLEKDVLPGMITEPFDLEFRSILLVLLGLIFFGIASWKGYRSDDPYPGYGRRDRQLKAIKNNYRNELGKARNGIEGVYKDCIRMLEDIRHRMEIKKNMWRDICDRGKRVVDQYPGNLRQYQDDLDYLISAYRTENRQARTEPSPGFFSKRLEVDPDILKPPSFETPVQIGLTDTEDSVHQAILRIQKAYEDTSHEYPSLEDITAEGFDRDNQT